MPIFHAIVLGIVQGLAEFLPISSSGHLIIVPWLFGWNDFAGNVELEKAFDTALHIGTLAAVIIYFWKDLWALVRALLRSIGKRAVTDTQERLAWLLVLTTIPGIITGALFDGVITEHLGSPSLIGVMLIVFGLILYYADRVATQRRQEFAEEDFTRRPAIVMGIAQALALQPGVSRSGVTISTGRFLGFSRSAAARISFLMATPITAGAALYKMAKLQADGGIPAGMGNAFVIGILVSGLVGWIAIAGLLKLIRTRGFTPFVIYRILAGALIILVSATGLR